MLSSAFVISVNVICECVTVFKFHAGKVNTGISTTYQVGDFKSNQMFEKIKYFNIYKTLRNKSITRNYRIQNKSIDYKIFKLKYRKVHKAVESVEI